MPGPQSWTLIVPLGSNLDDDFTLWRRMRECILDEIAQCVGNCSSIAGHRDRMFGAGQRDRPAG